MVYAVTGSPDYDLTGILPSDDTAAGRAFLSRYPISPRFDYTQFPKLTEVLRQQGFDDREVTTAPFACGCPGQQIRIAQLSRSAGLCSYDSRRLLFSAERSISATILEWVLS